MDSEKIIRRNILSKASEDKENYLHWLIRGWKSKDPDQALNHFLKALELNPGDPVVLDAIAYTQEHLYETSKVDEVTGSRLDEVNLNQKPRPTVNPNVPMEPSTAVSRNHPLINPKILYLAYLLWLALAEIVTTLSTPQVGLILHGILLVILFVLAAFDTQIIQYRLFLVLALAPLIRLLSLSMPLLQFEFMNWYMVIGIPLILASFIAMRQAGYKPTEIGLGQGRKLWLQVLVMLTGIGFGYLEYMILQPDPLIDSLTLQQFWYPALILLIFTGFLEEFIFRGMMQRATIQAMGWMGLIFTSSVFAVLHVGYRSILDVIFVFVVGLFFSLIVQKTHSIWGVTLAHGITNISLFLIFPLIL
jgi:membrane protease YdiL (CAAX protease family)